jgi:hypothetical protein
MFLGSEIPGWQLAPAASKSGANGKPEMQYSMPLMKMVQYQKRIGFEIKYPISNVPLSQ